MSRHRFDPMVYGHAGWNVERDADGVPETTHQGLVVLTNGEASIYLAPGPALYDGEGQRRMNTRHAELVAELLNLGIAEKFRASEKKESA